MRQTYIVLALALLAFGCESEKTTREREEQEAALEAEKKRQREKKLEAYYDMVWIDCVNELGIDRCRTIQETALFKYSTSKRGLDSSARYIMDDRHQWLIDKEANPEPEPELKPEAEPEPAPATYEEDRSLP